MKKLLPIALIAMMTVSASSRGLDLRSMSALRGYELGASGSVSESALLHRMPQAAPTQTAFVAIEPGYDRSDLEHAGMRVLTVIGDVALVEVPMNRLREISEAPGVGKMQLQRNVGTKMDRARADQKIDGIQLAPDQVGLDRTYTGRNVITAVIDAGFDPNHINFRYANGESRVGYLTWLRMNKGGTGIAEDQYNYTNVRDFITDDPFAYHATHTAGIMAGSYNGPVQVPGATPGANTHEVECPYYGVAPQSDIAVACGDLYDVIIAYGMEKLINYSKWEERPLPIVINMSLGSTSGARDEKSLINRVINTLAEEAVICISAGNEGDLKLAISRDLTDENTTIKSMIYPYHTRHTADDSNSRTMRQGSVEIWSEDARPFKLKAVIYNKKRDYKASLNMPVPGDNIATYYVSSKEYQVSDDDVVGDPAMVKAYEGYIGVGAKLDEDTGRYYGMVDYYTLNNMVTNLDDDYILGFEVEGEPGQRIDCYCDGSTTWLDSYGAEGFTDGGANGTISDMAVARNAICVGSYNTRDEWPILAGGTMKYSGDGFIPGHVSGFSSYGTLADGRNLPLICAPGSTVISSVSWPYAKMLPESEILNGVSAVLDEGGRINYWKQEAGTSMSAPFVSGSIALWLEANPELTPAEVRELVVRTAIRDKDVESGDPVQWGAGKFNALGGLKEAIRMSGIDGVTADGRNDRMLLTCNGDILNIFVGEAKSIEVAIYALDGSIVLSHKASGDETDIDISGLREGVYIVTANGRHTKKLLI